MKASELRLVAMLNKNNSVRLDPARVSFGKPKVAADKRYNTWIAVYANPDDEQYNISTTTAYNRVDSKTLGQRSVLTLTAYSQGSMRNAVAKYLTDTLDLPTDAQEISQRTVTVLKSGLVVAVYDFNDHPLAFGTITCKITLGRGDIDTVITKSKLAGFTEDKVGPKKISDFIYIRRLLGFSRNDVI